MISFVVSAILIVIAVLLLVFGRAPIRVERRTDGRYGGTEMVDGPRIGISIAVLLSVIAVLTLVLSSVTHVGSNEEGITNNFGTYTGTVGPGVHLVAPWTDTEKFTTRVQSKDVENSRVTLKSESETVVGIPASVDLTFRYHLAGLDKAKDMWRKYRTFGEVTKRLVVPEAKSSIRVVMGQYTPAQAKNGENVRKIGTEIKSNLGEALDDDGVIVDSVSVTDIGFSDDVEKRLAQIQAADANAQKAKVDAQTRLDTAKTDKLTADQQAAADAVRRTTATRETLIQDCLRVAANLHQPMDCNYYQTNQFAVAGAK